MKVSDEMLSAFLDGELSSRDMDNVRDAIAENVAIADRLAALAEVDMVVKAAAEKATATALPKEIIDLLATDSDNAVTNVTYLAKPDLTAPELVKQEKSSAKDSVNTQSESVAKLQSNNEKASWVKMPMALAASVALLAGLVFFQLGEENQPIPQGSHWANVSSALNNNLTGETARFAGDVSVTPQLSFVNAKLEYCRQAEVMSSEELNVMIACKDESNGWQLVASKLGASGTDDALYQTASSAKLMEEELDALMVSAPLTREQERGAVKQGWFVQSNKEGVKDEN